MLRWLLALPTIGDSSHESQLDRLDYKDRSLPDLDESLEPIYISSKDLFLISVYGTEAAIGMDSFGEPSVEVVSSP